MIIINIRPWVPLNGLLHTTTNWQISTDIDFTNILEEVVETTTYLNVYKTNIIVPKGIVYYARSQRILNEDIYLDWTPAKEILHIDNKEAVLINNQIVINKPSIGIVTSELLNPIVETFVIRTSVSDTIGDEHMYTHWILSDEKDNIIYSNLYNEDNLNELTINKVEINSSKLVKLKVTVIYGSSTCVESSKNTLIIDLHKINYAILNDLNNLNRDSDIVLDLFKVNTNLDTNITGVKIIDPLTGSEIYYNKIVTEVSTITIPMSVILGLDIIDIVLYTLQEDYVYEKTYRGILI